MNQVVFKEIEESDDEMPKMRFSGGFPVPKVVYKYSVEPDATKVSSVPQFLNDDPIATALDLEKEYTVENLIELARSSHSAQKAMALQKLTGIELVKLGQEEQGKLVLTARMALDSDSKTVVVSSIGLLANLLGGDFNDLKVWDARFFTTNG